MSDHQHGSMNIDVQEKTFDGFMKYVTRSVIFLLVLVVGMAIFIT